MGTPSPPRRSAASERRHSGVRGSVPVSGTAGTSSATSASASASTQARAAASVSSASVGGEIRKRDGGGCAKRIAVAPGRPR